jgi:carbamoyltransferase
MALAGHGGRELIKGDAFELANGRLRCAIRNNPMYPIQMVTELSQELGVDFGEPRPPGGAILDIHRHVAAFIQRCIEDALMTKLTLLRDLHRVGKLCIAGGVALNVVANGRLVELFHDGVYVPSAPGDDGQSLGNVYAALRTVRPDNRETARMSTSTTAFLGPAENINSAAVASALDATGHSSYVVFET